MHNLTKNLALHNWLFLYYDKGFLYPHHQKANCQLTCNIKQHHNSINQNKIHHMLFLITFQELHNMVNHRQFLLIHFFLYKLPRPKSTNFKFLLPLFNKIFSGLISLCTIPSLWIYSRQDINCLNN